MRSLLYLLGAALTLPSLALALFFEGVARAAAQRTLGEATFHVPALIALGLAVWQLSVDPRAFAR